MNLRSSFAKLSFINIIAAACLAFGPRDTIERASHAVEEIKAKGRSVSKGEFELREKADLIVIGTVSAVTNLSEETNLVVNNVLERVFATDTHFTISKVLKGRIIGNQVILHHYHSIDGESSNMVTIDGNSFAIYANSLLPPGLINLKPDPTNEYKLYLDSYDTNSFVPATGQSDATFSILALPHPWDSSYSHEANPSILEKYQFMAPAKLKVVQFDDMLEFWADPDSLNATPLLIGTNMIVGFWCDIYVNKVGSPRPTKGSHNLEPTIGAFMPNTSETNVLRFQFQPYCWNTNGRGIAVPASSIISLMPTRKRKLNTIGNGRYNIEMDLTIFETDSLNVRPDWNPQHARYYKVLSKMKLKQRF